MTQANKDQRWRKLCRRLLEACDQPNDEALDALLEDYQHDGYHQLLEASAMLQTKGMLADWQTTRTGRKARHSELNRGAS